eukprot:UN07110
MQNEKTKNFILSKYKTHSEQILLSIGRHTYGPAEKLRKFIELNNKENTVLNSLEKKFHGKRVKPAVVLLIIDKDGNLLLTKRENNMRTFPGAWVLPGGST